MTKFVSYLSYGLLGISALFGILFYTQTISEEPFLILSYILFGIAVIATLGFALVQIFGNAQAAKRALMGLGILVVVVLISWLIASPEIPKFIGSEEFNLTPAISRNVGTILIVAYILAIVAFGSMIYSEVKNFFK